MCKYLVAESHYVDNSFSYIEWKDLIEIIQSPPFLGDIQASEAKNKSAIIAATDAPNKQKKTILAHNKFTLLRLDLDDTPFEINTISDNLNGMGLESYAIHTTASHHQDSKSNRYRIYIELADAITYDVWAMLETYLNFVFSADDCAIRPQQIMYLPCRFFGDNYQHLISIGKPLHIDGSNLKTEAEMFLENQHIALKRARKEAAVTIRPSHHKALIGNQVSIIDTINQSYRWDDLLPYYGYKKQGKAWLPPEATSNIAGAYILTSNTDGKERYYSHHQNDPCAIDCCVDIFDFISIRSYGNNRNKALKDLAETHFEHLNNHNKKEFVTSQKNKKVRSRFGGRA